MHFRKKHLVNNFLIFGCYNFRMVAKTEVNELKALLDELTYLFMELASLYEYRALLIEADIHSYTSERSA